MKKRFLLFGILCVFGGLFVSAQQLPNVGFENWKAAAEMTDAYGKNNTAVVKRQRPGVEPQGWNGSSVNQNVGIGGDVKQTLVTKDAGFSGSCVKLQNKFVGMFGIGDEAPGYITLGTPWVYAETNTKVCDGGTYGGVSFTNTPDALSVQLKRTDANAESSTVIAYLWNGNFNSKIGKLNAANIDESNVERAILNKSNAGTITGNGKLVASVDKEIAHTEFSTGAWKKVEFPFNYVEGAGEPTMMNIIVCAGNYWQRTSLLKETTLFVDDLQLIYYSKLKSLSVGGVPVPNFKEDVYHYDMAMDLPTVDKVQFEVLGRSAIGSVSTDEKSGTISITVTNVGADKDGLNEHTYILQFNKPIIKREGAKYDGTLDITLNGNNVHLDNQSVYIEFAPDGTSCTFSLYDFSLDGSNIIGDIVIENVAITTTEINGRPKRNFAGEKKGLVLSNGAIVADVTLNGIEDFYSGHLEMNIPVLWKMDPADPNSVINIGVLFNGGIDSTSGIENLLPSNVMAYGINGALVINGFEGMARVYSMDGRLVKTAWVSTEAQLDLMEGLYIVRLGNKAVKVVVR